MTMKSANLLVALLLAFALHIGSPKSAYAVQPEEMLKDPKLEQRARKLSAGLRCLVCQNQSIDDSDAPLAKDLRVLVRERLVKGDTDNQIIDLVVARYGEFVLLNPRFNTSTFLLWLATPLLLLVAAALLLWNRNRAGITTGTIAGNANLTEDERKQLEDLLGKDA